MTDVSTDLLDELWCGAGPEQLAPRDHRYSSARRSDALDAVSFFGPEQVLPSIYDVTGFASATVGAATVAGARLFAARNGVPAPTVSVDRRAASVAFVSEALFTPDGWEAPPIWDPMAGDYRAADGWIRLHTNYRYHRDAALGVLGLPTTGADRDAVAAAVREWSADDLEDAVVKAGGCAAAMHDRSAWLASPPGAAAAAEPLARIATRPADVPDVVKVRHERPYGGIRVLDLTRVIAGPVATRFLAAYGADVLRVDPPGFAEVPVLLPETTVGKRCTALDLTARADRETFERLLAETHVLVCGLRPDALTRLGYDVAALRRYNPSLITARLDAYGWDGPWQGRRGFDSLVQMSCGIAAAGAAAARADKPVPLPAQALDHGTGYLVAAAVGIALRRLAEEGVASDIRMSLVGTANALCARPVVDGLRGRRPEVSSGDLEPTRTAWGSAHRVPTPGHIDGVPAAWTIDAGPLGRHAPSWG